MIWHGAITANVLTVAASGKSPAAAEHFGPRHTQPAAGLFWAAQQACTRAADPVNAQQAAVRSHALGRLGATLHVVHYKWLWRRVHDASTDTNRKMVTRVMGAVG